MSLAMIVSTNMYVQQRKLNCDVMKFCMDGDVASLQSYIASGKDVNVCKSKWTPLMVACMCGKLDVVQLLLDNGASLKANEVCNWTPLHFACLFKHPQQLELITLLLKYGADIDASSTKWKITPLAVSLFVEEEDDSFLGENSIYAFLLKHGASPDKMHPNINCIVPYLKKWQEKFYESLSFSEENFSEENVPEEILELRRELLGDAMKLEIDDIRNHVTNYGRFPQFSEQEKSDALDALLDPEGLSSTLVFLFADDIFTDPKSIVHILNV